MDNQEKENQELENKEVQEAEAQEQETEKNFSNDEKKEYNDSKIEKEQSLSLEQEVQAEQDKKFLAKTIVDLKDENSQIKSMLSEILSKLKINSSNFTDSQVKSNNDNDLDDDNDKSYVIAYK